MEFIPDSIKTGNIYPLQESVLENIKVKVPFDYKTILEEEYGKRALVSRKHHWY